MTGKGVGKQKTASDKERVQVLYLLKSKQAETVQTAAKLVNRDRVTVQEWFKEYSVLVAELQSGYFDDIFATVVLSFQVKVALLVS